MMNWPVCGSPGCTELSKWLNMVSLSLHCNIDNSLAVMSATMMISRFCRLPIRPHCG
ncbi:hypothetical protein COCON_G00068160, partial [Conger conger]